MTTAEHFAELRRLLRLFVSEEVRWELNEVANSLEAHVAELEARAAERLWPRGCHDPSCDCHCPSDCGEEKP